MAKVITFSTTFPAYHPKKGDPTFFVEKFLSGEKVHTIRANNRFKQGEYFSPRFWSEKPYNSKQITFAEDTLITKVYDFEIKQAYKMLPLDYDTDIIINHWFYHSCDSIIIELAKNDGLSKADLLNWFKYPQPFQGQIICWGDVKY